MIIILIADESDNFVLPDPPEIDVDDYGYADNRYIITIFMFKECSHLSTTMFIFTSLLIFMSLFVFFVF